MEKLSIVNEKDEVVGESDIEIIHQRGLLHRSVHIFIIDSQGKLFCRQRSFKKQRYTGYWSTSVGAHVLLGQTYDEVAYKSLSNTLGIKCGLKMIGKARVSDNYENEISALYIGNSDKGMKFNIDQVEGGNFLTIEEIKELIKQKNVTPHLSHSLNIYLDYIKK